MMRNVQFYLGLFIVDFTGIRDIDELMRMANETGIYVSARPGPYM
jgi:beta-galactosidase GanA